MLEKITTTKEIQQAMQNLSSENSASENKKGNDSGNDNYFHRNVIQPVNSNLSDSG